MGIAWKVLVGLVLLLPMTAYVVGSLVAAADEPPQHQPIIVEDRTKTPDNQGKSPSDKPTKKPRDDKTDRGDDHGGNSGRGGGDDDDPEVITPSPDDFDDDFDDDDFDDNGGNSGPGGGDDDNSGKGSGDD